MTETPNPNTSSWAARLVRMVPVGALAALAFLVLAQAWSIHPPDDGLRLQNGQLIGGDFVAFYTGGVLMRDDPGRLYDLEHQRRVRVRILERVPNLAAADLPFVYPPLVAALMVPFTYLDLATAYYVWVVLAVLATSLALAGVTIAIRRRSTSETVLGTLALFAFVPFSIDTLVGGQISWLGVVVFASVAGAVWKRRPGLAGLIMALGYYKPPLFLFAAFYLAIRLPVRFLGGCAIGATVATALTVWARGVEGTLAYVSMASGYRYGREVLEGVSLPPEAGVGFFALFTSLLGTGGANAWALAVVLLLLLIPAVVMRVRDEPVSRPELAYLITASVAVSVQAIAYDMSLLLVAFVILASGFGELPVRIRWALGLGIAFFYLEFLVRRLALGGTLANASWFAFAWLLGGLLVATFHASGRAREGAP